MLAALEALSAREAGGGVPLVSRLPAASRELVAVPLERLEALEALEEPRAEPTPKPRRGRPKREPPPPSRYQLHRGEAAIRPTSGLRPSPAGIRQWADDWSAELYRNADGSYDALVELADLEEGQKAALEAPRPALIQFRATLRAPQAGDKIAKSESPDDYDDAGNWIISTNYVRSYHPAVAVVEIPYDRYLDEYSIGLAVHWPSKDSEEK